MFPSPTSPARTAGDGRHASSTARCCDPDRARHRRPLARLDPQAGRPGLARLRRADRVRSRDRIGETGSLFDTGRCDGATTRPRAGPPRRDAVRRGGRGHGQDHGAGRPGRRAGRDRGVADAQRSPRSRSPRRRRPSCATASGRARAASTRAEPTAVPASRSTSSTAPRSPRCTPSRSGSSPSTRSRPACRRGSRCSTRSRSSQVAFDERWGAVRRPSCSTIPSSSHVLLARPRRRRRLRPPLRAGRRALHANWDLVDRADRSAPRAPDAARRRRRPDPRRSRRRSAPRSATSVPTPTTSCSVRLDEFSSAGRAAAPATRRRSTASTCCGPEAVVQGGQRRPQGLELAMRHRSPTARALAPTGRRAVTDARRRCETRRIRHVLGRPAASSRAQRRRGAAAAAGELEFHDLLVLARDTLRVPDNGRAVRAALHRRYPHLLIDEFQDTDPIQVEMAALIACGRSGPRPRALAGPWTSSRGSPVLRRRPEAVDLPVPARRHRHLPAGSRQTGADTELLLTRNFRTTGSVLAWINHVFGELIDDADPGVAARVRAALEADARRRRPRGPVVTLLGAEPTT